MMEPFLKFQIGLLGVDPIWHRRSNPRHKTWIKTIQIDTHAKPVGALRLAGPEVRVAGRLRAAHVLGVLGQRQGRKREGESPARQGRATLAARLVVG